MVASTCFSLGQGAKGAGKRLGMGQLKPLQIIRGQTSILEELTKGTYLEVFIAVNGHRKNHRIIWLCIDMMAPANPLQYPAMRFQHLAQAFARNRDHTSISMI